MGFAEIAVTVNDPLRVLVLVLHIFPLQFFRHIIVFALADLIQISAFYRRTVGELLHLRSSGDHTHQRSSGIFVVPVISEFLFCFVPVKFISFSRSRQAHGTDVHFTLVKLYVHPGSRRSLFIPVFFVLFFRLCSFLSLHSRYFFRRKVEFSRRRFRAESGVRVFFGFFRCGSRILCICVRSDLICKRLRYGSASYHDLDTGTEGLLQKSRHGVSQRRHGCGKKSGKSHDRSVFILVYRINKSLDRHIHAKVKDFKTCAFKHHAHKILTDIVKVSGNRSQNDLAGASRLTGCEIRLQHFHASLHGAGSRKHLRYENDFLLEVLSHYRHGSDHAVVKDGGGIASGVQRFLNALTDFFIFSCFCRLENSAHFFIHFILRLFFFHRSLFSTGAEFRDIIQAVFIFFQKSVCRVDHSDHVFVGRIHDGAVHSRVHRQHHERLVDVFSHRKAVGNIGKAACDMNVGILCLDLAAALGKYRKGCLVCGQGDNQGVDMKTAGRDIIFLRFFHDSMEYFHSFLHRIRDSVVVAQKGHAFPVGICNDREDRIDLISLQGNRVYKTGSLT